MIKVVRQLFLFINFKSIISSSAVVAIAVTFKFLKKFFVSPYKSKCLDQAKAKGTIQVPCLAKYIALN